MNWIPVGNLEDIPQQGSRVISTSKGEIALFRTLEDEIFAIDNRCPHKGGPLSQGIVHGKRVTCPLHNWVISLASGEALAPDTGCTHRHEVRQNHGVLFLAVDAPSSKE
ncbi:MAG: nitrite reductase (NAD(P)H) small subunit [Ferrovum sp. 37-45-19]|uniref:nitrite reductase small subunit NirD n=1 Tax=Ferrovum sp. JA12 TaxID=1356299 RepID=UPI000702BB18|nr:nitrite reductase small subunit NirD [Ferrovum sp. JA12]OYV79448.1 MAG: nitrite reductase (NAD(P)H) small subunit [Ferrovum sp. 21-44-67]OYV95119.1 MAG: nitrite reductase (NAD(P)H) small subunit [Ferrovum sp. 37-45-19]OZB34227.1 MAG: nitrite reductase (NAD(P)H) small subunit [Ferrovum sp. 34-44-207]HQT80963.1 nitrite reductase small subunit NirD [Ferrovaceae bacterium]KRH78804.1 assimilatory nitrite reductase [NAD(P)H] small subunit [Ferrovum sp. JA12]